MMTFPKMHLICIVFCANGYSIISWLWTKNTVPFLKISYKEENNTITLFSEMLENSGFNSGDTFLIKGAKDNIIFSMVED